MGAAGATRIADYALVALVFESTRTVRRVRLLHPVLEDSFVMRLKGGGTLNTKEPRMFPAHTRFHQRVEPHANQMRRVLVRITAPVRRESDVL